MRKYPRRNILRIDRTTSSGRPFRGWEVRLQRRGVKTLHFFNDAHYGGNRGALRAAQQWRDVIERQARGYRLAELAKRPSRRNRSGIVGVRRQPPRDAIAHPQAHRAVWIAQWTNGHGKRKSRVFSVARYGEQEAKQLARQARRAGVRRSGR